jgi:Taurine catabolism dioxygenase TauD, TfdA family
MALLHPVGGPSAWMGQEMEGRSDWIVELGAEERSELSEAMLQAERLDVGLQHMRRSDFRLPKLTEALARLVEELVDGRGLVLLRGVPVEGLTEKQIELMFWGIGLHVGIALPQGPEGKDLFAHVRDEGVDRHATHGGGLLNRHNQSLPFHTDSSDLVGLLCIRPAMKGGTSTLVSTAAVHDELLRRRPDLLEIMYEPWWFDRRRGDGPESFVQCPIYAMNDSGRLFAFYGPDLIKSAPRGEGVPPLTPQQVEAMAVLDELNSTPEFQLHMDFRCGDIQFINNYAVMHSRTSYEDHPDPALKRDLIRLWLTLEHDLKVPPSFQDRGFVSRAAAFGRP